MIGPKPSAYELLQLRTDYTAGRSCLKELRSTGRYFPRGTLRRRRLDLSALFVLPCHAGIRGTKESSMKNPNPTLGVREQRIRSAVRAILRLLPERYYLRAMQKFLRWRTGAFRCRRR